MSDVARERALSDADVAEAQRAGKVFLALMRRVARTLTARDRVYLELGMRASHLEEALAHGELERAQAHYRRILEIARNLR